MRPDLWKACSFHDSFHHRENSQQLGYRSGYPEEGLDCRSQSSTG